ncbi:hypothetical protein K1T71_000615 [Dendrolimus kikuchii]|uniref:Uncharacterized protein n=1 Tax=Dendrolimus kikuchii TaxID=765133 RepID=A0ACC1DKW1_9NEOP|nr:hypothetical protein K1T71_000615 [Dendrolimus kikuchii]
MKCVIIIVSFIVFTTSAQFESLPADIASIKIVPIHPQTSFNLSKYITKQKVLRKPYEKRYDATRLVSALQEDEVMKEEASNKFTILKNNRNKMVTKHKKPRTFNKNRIHKKDLSLDYDNPYVFKDTKEKYVNKKEDDVMKEKDEHTKESEESDENKTPILRNADIDLNYDIDAPLLRIMW